MHAASRLIAAMCTALAVAGCAGQPQEAVWRPICAVPGTCPATPEVVAKFRTDEAQCEYDVAQMQVMAPRVYVPASGPYASGLSALGSAMVSGPGPAVFDACMRARGWHRAG